jgi:hypothetical protein
MTCRPWANNPLIHQASRITSRAIWVGTLRNAVHRRSREAKVSRLPSNPPFACNTLSAAAGLMATGPISNLQCCSKDFLLLFSPI